ncbi:O-antigen ligase family protein [Mesorhizobium sp. B2-4-17]|uniref:O-antigen ligase family protein n=1 Tax=Mesorhizobium sp. B2-4-17 TaxID=2589932 RepID=UPI00112653C7|nr:O-antigen ligase family protein [Mesorhizobium sp. B2-4-17]TPK91797.1 O-antigen ligase family protein [Mesorhizobium sp. B2-4-17]
MSSEIEIRRPTRLWLAGIFVAAIFMGSVGLLHITLPICVLLLPFFFLDRQQLSLRIPAAAVPLLCIGAIIVVQFALNFSNPAFNPRSDTALWLPSVFAGVTIIAMRNAGMPDSRALNALVLGGILTSAVMVLMILFAPKDMFLLEQQNMHVVEKKYEAEKAQEPVPPATDPTTTPMTQPSSPAASSLASAPATEEAFVPNEAAGRDSAFYDLKNRAKNALGTSNYIAVFLIFLFAVTLFTGPLWVAVVFGVLTLVTLSRFGIAFMVPIVAIYLLRRKTGAVRTATVVAMLVSVGGAVGLYFLDGSSLLNISGVASLVTRFALWESGFGAAALHPIIGAPRSVVLVQLGYSITWNPHNSVLWIVTHFGLLGLAAYCAYVWIVMREIAKAAATSRLWTGVFVGVAMILSWSLVENIVLTPAFEILFAALYALALNRNREAAG